jgi:hypothetical protein
MKSQNNRNHGFSIFFFLMKEESIAVRMNPDSYLVLMDPDPGGPKTYGIGSGSATLLLSV